MKTITPRPRPINFFAMLLIIGILACIVLHLVYNSRRLTRLEKELKLAEYSKEFCNGK